MEFRFLTVKPGALVEEREDTRRVFSEWMERDSFHDGISMYYSDYMQIRSDGTILHHPLIDYQRGSLRDDFDFGAIVCVRESLLMEWIERNGYPLPDTKGFEEILIRDFYSLRLFLSLHGEIRRVPEPLYSIHEHDPRKSGEKQFDYVDPRNREYQIRMENLCTEALKEMGAYLPERESGFRESEESYKVTASVVIPVLNRVSTIADAIESALSQKTDFTYNIIVVDNHSSDGTSEKIAALSATNPHLHHLIPESSSLGIGGCWNYAVNFSLCGEYAVQLDSDDLYSSEKTLQKIIDKFREEGCAMVIGSYQMTDFDLNPIPPGIIDHKEWSDRNGHNNALRINGLGAPRAFRRDLLRRIGGFPNVSYGEDYAVALRIVGEWRIGRIYEPIYYCRRWSGNSDAALSIEKTNANNLFKDLIRSNELERRIGINRIITPETLFSRQLEEWPEVRKRYEALWQVETSSFTVNGFRVKVIFNPARAVSTLAKVDSESIAARKCFLCPKNLTPEQIGIPITLRERYHLLVNPFPILPEHFTIPTTEHVPQNMTICRYEDMLTLAQRYSKYVIFFNGPLSGASAPDHFHFQMGSKGFLPVEKDFDKLKLKKRGRLCHSDIFSLENYVTSATVIISDSVLHSAECFGTLSADNILDYNLIAWSSERGFVTVIFPRSSRRPLCFDACEEERIRISPGCADMAGAFICPVEEDFRRVTAEKLTAILRDVTPERSIEPENHEPFVDVGLMRAERVRIDLHGTFVCERGSISGEEEFMAAGGKIIWRGRAFDTLFFEPEKRESCSFEVRNVTIGIGFHWERKENQIFKGKVLLLPVGNDVQVINVVGVEEYLHSVISSEMSKGGSKEFLKAHAVISRSWLLSRSGTEREKEERIPAGMREESGKHIKWYEREDHTLFDVCADDHCQRYQGIIRSDDPKIAEAIGETRGEVLKYDGEICDTRFSKCCGGISERFSVCWADKDFPYLSPVKDPYCNTRDAGILSRLLNDYDRETQDFYRWSVEYTQEEISGIIASRTGIDFGAISGLTPIKRGESGRIYEMEISGSRRTMVIGKELEIRKCLSRSHLYSSAFEVESIGTIVKEGIAVPEKFILRGKGWGHGVGLCQIGAAVMGERGFTYKEILEFYFKGASICREY